MVTNVSALVGLLFYWGTLYLLFRVLHRAISQRRLGLLAACLSYWLAAVSLPHPIWQAVGITANSLYSNYPALWEQSWDVGLVLILYLGARLSWATGFLAACVASWKFIVCSRRLRQIART